MLVSSSFLPAAALDPVDEDEIERSSVLGANGLERVSSLRQLRPSGANWKPFGHKQDVLADFEVN